MRTGDRGERHLVVASVGTYHLPFDRFSQWLERWVATRADVELVMQHGPSQSVAGARNVATLPYGELIDLCRSAEVVVLQGGAGGVMDMRSIGIVPIVVPRIPGGGEVVDDHQVIFCRAMERLGIVVSADSYELLASLLDSRLAPSDNGRSVPVEPLATPGAHAVALLLSQPIPRISLRTVVRRLWSTWSSLLLPRLRRSGR